MVVLDTSAAVEYLLGLEAASAVEAILADDGPHAAPDVITFEVLAVLRRRVLRGELASDRAESALDDLGDLPLLLFPSMDLRTEAWALRDNFTMADALFVVLARELGVPLATKDGPLAVAASRFVDLTTIEVAAARH